MKDLFSTHASEYARFRPGYPEELFTFLFSLCRHFDTAWDVATGNGQIAVGLAERFTQVYATDISEKQLEQAQQRTNIQYNIGSAESPDFPDQYFDLVTVGQAAHWFELDAFYAAVQRVLKPGGMLALIGYSNLKIDAPTDAIIEQFYRDVVGNYWEPERDYVDAQYSNLHFPFTGIALPAMAATCSWNLEQLLGYLQTWSAVRKFQEQQGRSPIDADFIAALQLFWADNEVKLVHFPTFARIARL